MQLATIGFLLHTSGELLIAFTVLRVHHRVLHDHKIDKKVFEDMRLEQFIGIVGVIMIITGASMQIL